MKAEPESEKFHPMGAEDELEFLRNDEPSFSRTQLYLMPLVNQILSRTSIPSNEQMMLRSQILSDVPIAAERFLANYNEERGYQFAAYFTWYIHERLR